jgi:peroxiredoxin
MLMLKPKDRAPELIVKTLDSDKDWRLAEQQPATFTMIVFYRGWHCPLCHDYLQELARKLAEFQSRGVNVIAISGDARERAQAARDEWQLGGLTLGYGFEAAQADAWGLYITQGKSPDEPETFNEPGLFLIRADGTIYAAFVQSTPYARPNLDQVLAAIDFMEVPG